MARVLPMVEEVFGKLGYKGGRGRIEWGKVLGSSAIEHASVACCCRFQKVCVVFAIVIPAWWPQCLALSHIDPKLRGQDVAGALRRIWGLAPRCIWRA